MRLAILVLFVLFATQSEAQVTPLKSFGYMTADVPCTSHDQLMPLDAAGNNKAPPALPGSGDFPAGLFYVRQVCVSHTIQGGPSDYSYAVVGHSGPNGDLISPLLPGTGSTCIAFNTAPVVFSPGEYIDLHAKCVRGTHWATLQIWFTDH